MKRIGIVVLSCCITASMHGMDLIKAARKGDGGRVQELLLSGADVNAKNFVYDTPLQFAVLNGHQKIVEILLDYKADVNASNWDGDTPLYLALMFGQKEIAKLLLSKGASPQEALFSAIKDDYPGTDETARILLEISHGIGINTRYNGRTLLHTAIFEGHCNVVKLLLDNGANVDEKNCDGNTALYLAVKYGYLKICKILLEHRALCDIRTLNIAVQKGHSEIVNLIKNGSKRARENMLTLLLAKHTRVGAQSPARYFDQQVFTTIFNLLKKEKHITT